MKYVLLISSLLTFCLILPQTSYSQDTLKTLIKKYEELEEKLDSLKKDKQFILSVGGNLNFLENPQISGLYYDMSTNFASIAKDTSSSWNRFGLGARLAQGRFVAGKDSFTIDNTQTRIDSLDNGNIRVLDQDFTSKREEIRSYLSISATPTYRLFKEEGSPLQLALHLEFLRRNTTTKTEQIVNRQDTLTTAFDPDAVYRRLPVKNDIRSREIIDYNLLFIPGLQFYINHKNIDFSIKSLIGPGVIIQSNSSSEWKWNYMTHFVVHFKGSGSFKVGGEIRSFFGEVPRTTVYIAKTFSLQTLADLF